MYILLKPFVKQFGGDVSVIWKMVIFFAPVILLLGYFEYIFLSVRVGLKPKFFVVFYDK